MSKDATRKSPAREGDEANELEPERRDRLRASVLARTGGEMSVARAAEQPWRSFLPGVSIKVLHSDSRSGVQTAMWKMNPGARIPAHPHGQEEECFILEGELVHRGETYRAGDYMVAPAGSRHATIHAPDGAVMLIRGERVSWRERLFLRASLALGR